MIKIKSAANVYPPSEDSYLLLKAVKYAHGEVLDMFAGSGIIGISAAPLACKVTFVDISAAALALVRLNAKINGIKNYEVLRSNLFTGLNGHFFDTIYMNPPYLPGIHKGIDYLDIATIGGHEGYEITLRAIDGLRSHLKPGGEAFLILSTAYDLDKVYKRLMSLNFKFKVLDTKRFFFEELILLRIYEKRRYNDGKRADYSGGTNKFNRTGASFKEH
jgi:release factor glutamine methyltransferase